jgi:hypothetical protein
MSSRKSTRSQAKKRKGGAEAGGIAVTSLNDLPPDELLRIHELIRGKSKVQGSLTKEQKAKQRYVSEARKGVSPRLLPRRRLTHALECTHAGRQLEDDPQGPAVQCIHAHRAQGEERVTALIGVLMGMSPLGMRADTTHPCLTPPQVALPPSLQPAADDEDKYWLRSWVTSLAAFLKRQPASQEVDLPGLACSSVSAALPLAPFITSLQVNVDIDDDMSRVLSSVCKVLPPPSLPHAWRYTRPTSPHSPLPLCPALTELPPPEGSQAGSRGSEGRAAALLLLQDPC